MHLENLRKYAFLLLRFRNGLELVRAVRSNRPCSNAVLWDGKRITHPQNRGFVHTLLELWADRTYTDGGFYVARPGDVVLDIGAHVGLFSLWLARKYPFVRIVAVEPEADNYACLVANVRGLGDISTYRLAVAGEEGHGRLQTRTDRSIDHQLTPAHESETNAVRVLTLGSVLRLSDTQRVALLKMDIEGAERGVFEQVPDDVLNRIDRIALEYHDHICPGTLGMLLQRLRPDYDIQIRTITGRLYGMLLATRRGLSGGNLGARR